MFVARQLKETNICEYLLYMWQVEDTLRAYALDEDRLREEYAARFPEEQQAEEARWLGHLVGMMREEGRQERGHLQMNVGTLSLLTDLHRELLRSPKHPFYAAAYYKALPFIVELRAKGGAEKPELETCLDALYGVMLLRLQGREVGPDTRAALQHVSHLLALLNDAYQKDKQGTLEL